MVYTPEGYRQHKDFIRDSHPDAKCTGRKKQKNKAYKWTVRLAEPVRVFSRFSLNERHFVKKEDADNECEKRNRAGLRPELNPVYIVVPYESE